MEKPNKEQKMIEGKTGMNPYTMYTGSPTNWHAVAQKQMDILTQIKMECEKTEVPCIGCRLYTEEGCLLHPIPDEWDIEEIRRRLTYDK